MLQCWEGANGEPPRAEDKPAARRGWRLRWQEQVDSKAKRLAFLVFLSPRTKLRACSPFLLIAT